MQITLKKIKIKDICDGYIDNDEEGITGFGGKLNIRPKYQREFIYNEKEQKAVIETIIKGFPLNTMYWAKNPDGSFEVLDGQQRTISFCEYRSNNFSVEFNGFPVSYRGLPKAVQNIFDNYECMIYICEGTTEEKLSWFQIINIAGKTLTQQELRNAVYSGSWTTSAKKFFSKTNCKAYGLASKYLSGILNRQDYLETAIDWISDGNINSYMDEHRFADNADELWNYFEKIIEWVKKVFPKYRAEMKGVNWGELYKKYSDKHYSVDELEEKIHILMADSDVTNKKGIYSYVLGEPERVLSVRPFDSNMKREAYEHQNGICPHCHKHFDIEEMEGDHIIPWHSGGHTVASNCQMLCKNCNRIKGGR